jgi:hypothetical protein
VATTGSKTNMTSQLNSVSEDESLTDPKVTVYRFFRAIDDREYRLLLSLLAPDMVWRRQGVALHGEREILSALERRSPTLRVHHILTNMVALPCEEGEVDVSGYMLVVLHDSGAEVNGAAPLAGVDSIRMMRARLRRIDQGWRMVRLASDAPTFVK